MSSKDHVIVLDAMGQLIRLCYASHATLDPNQIGFGLDRLASRSRIFNQQFGITSVLYYGKGFFFQCLEGEAEVVDKLYKKIRKDQRHEEVMLLDREPVEIRAFTTPMKVVIINDEIRAAYHSTPEHPFLPTRLRRREVGTFLTLLQQQPNYERLTEFQHNSTMITVVGENPQLPLVRPMVLVLVLLILILMGFLLVPFFHSSL